MPQYIDGFVLPLPKKNLKAYKKMAETAAKVWMEHGALAYYECVGEDLAVSFGMPFPKLCKCKAGETVVYAFAIYKNRAHRDRVCKKVMADARLAAACDPKNMPFNTKQMAWGGFETLIARNAR